MTTAAERRARLGAPSPPSGQVSGANPDALLRSISVIPATGIVEFGNPASVSQMNAIATYESGAVADVTNAVTWVSSDETVVTVDEYGTVSLHGNGSTIITAIWLGVTSSSATLTGAGIQGA